MNQKYQQCKYDEHKKQIDFNPLSLSKHQEESDIKSSSIEHGRDSSDDEKIFEVKHYSEQELNTVIVFDYDDTLFPTTFIKTIFKRNTPIKSTSRWSSIELMRRINQKETDQLISLSYVTLELLKLYIQKYSMKNIFIVSASCRRWIEKSLSIVQHIGFYKQICQILKSFKNPIINCDASRINPPKNKKFDATKWKYNKFESILKNKNFFSEKKNNKKYRINTFVSIGDSTYEFEASGRLRNNKNTFFVHRVKFIHYPLLNQLYLEQCKLYHSCLYFKLYSMINKQNVDEDYTKWIENYNLENQIKLI